MCENQDAEQIKQEWLSRLNVLVDQVEEWAKEWAKERAKELEWATRRIEINRTDSRIGKYKVPGLILQGNEYKMLLEPISCSVLGAEGLVDLYLMPAYDDIASLLLKDGEWQIHYVFHSDEMNVGDVLNVAPRKLTKDSLRDVLKDMKSHVV